MGGTEKLIAAVKKHPVLYADLENNTTKDKNAAWEIVARLTADPGGVEACKRKWRSLRDSYRKYLRAKNMGPGNQNDALARYKKWSRAHLMEFMHKPLQSPSLVDPFQQSNQSWYDLPEDNFTNSEDDNEIIQHKNEAIEKNSSVSTENENQKLTTNFEEAILAPPITARRNKTLRNNSERIRRPSYTFTPKEDVDYIFIGYAKMMKKFSPKRQARLKFNISKLFMEEELAQLAEDEQNEHGGRSKLPSRKKKRRSRRTATSSDSSWMQGE